MTRRFFAIAMGMLLAAAVAIITLMMPGCDVERGDGYSEDITFPPRNDPLVLDAGNATPPVELYPPGKLEEGILALAGRGGKLLAVSAIPVETRTRIRSAMDATFGKPSAPKLEGFDPDRLAEGARVYKKRCIECHGLVGDGRGPTSLWVYPHARDFRTGAFKYVSTGQGLGWPTRDDLARVIRRGLPGASMQSYAMLPTNELEAVVDYVLFLAFRGKVEYELLRKAVDDPSEDYPAQAVAELMKWQRQWKEALASELKPTPPESEIRDGGSDETYDQRIRAGHTLFLGETAGCAKCHVDYGRQSLLRYDIGGVPVKPCDLTKGEPRGGKEPMDYYFRLRAGIVPVGMPPMSALSDEQVWNLVLFLRALPDPRHLPADVREAVYK